MPALAPAAQSLLPQRLLGRVVYAAARSRNRWLKRALIRWFVRHYRVDLADAVVTEPAGYGSFNEFFTRALKAGARPVAAGADVVVSPVDGTLTEFGALAGNRAVQAKGMLYTLEDLLAEPGSELDAFVDGQYATIYLAPHDYHRVHAPAAGRLERVRYVPGTRFSVNAATAARIPNLFCRNERAALWLRDASNSFVVVMVGALNVASISTTIHGEIPSARPMLWQETDGPAFERGGELGRFNLGSTVVVLFPSGAMSFDPALTPGQRLRMGQAIGSLARAVA